MNSLRVGDVFPQSRPKLFIECTNTYHSNMQAGIQRVVRNILRHAGELAGNQGYELVPIIFDDGQFREVGLHQLLHDKTSDGLVVFVSSKIKFLEALRRIRPLSMKKLLVEIGRAMYRPVRRVLLKLFPFQCVRRFLEARPDNFGLVWCFLQPWRLVRRLWSQLLSHAASKNAVDALCAADVLGLSPHVAADHKGNILLLLDAAWQLPFLPIIRQFQRNGGTCHTVIYDLIPISHPHTVGMRHCDEYTEWLKNHIQHNRRFVTISRAVADDFRSYLSRERVRDSYNDPWSIVPFHLGSELDLIDPHADPRDAVKLIFAGNDPVFIVVGSIEPRKNHAFILDAFDLLWQQGSTARLVVIGRHGWKTEALIKRMEHHRQAGQKLFLMRDMADAELNYAYREASALIIASMAEGFGLPVVEAFQCGLPVLCSDIPVFREIADGKAIFFQIDDPTTLAAAVSEFCATHDSSDLIERKPQPWLTWRESAQQLLDVVFAQSRAE